MRKKTKQRQKERKTLIAFFHRVIVDGLELHKHNPNRKKERNSTIKSSFSLKD